MSVCFIKCLLFLKISPNCKTLFYKTFSKNLAFSALKVSITFHTCLLASLCFALKVSKTFHKPLSCLLYLLFINLLLACFTLLYKFIKLFINMGAWAQPLALKVYKTFHRPLVCFALKVYKTFYKHGSLGSTACFKSL